VTKLFVRAEARFDGILGAVIDAERSPLAIAATNDSKKMHDD